MTPGSAKLTTTFGDIELSAGADVQMTGERQPRNRNERAMDWEAGANAKVTLTPEHHPHLDFIFSSRKTRG